MEQCGFDSKHGFELKFFFSIFWKLNQIKINKTGVKLQAYVTLQILCNLWIQSKIWRNLYENVKIWKKCVSIFSTFYCKPFCLEAKHTKVTLTLSWRRPLSYRNQSDRFLYDNDLRHERVNAFSPSNQLRQLLPKENHRNWNSSFRNFLLKHETRIKDK